MHDFIDLRGASGADYRFRVWRDGASHLPVAGNFVIVKAGAENEAVTVLMVGVTNDLSRARLDLAKVAERGATHVYTRLNVARTVRTAEHQDLVAGCKPAVVSDGV